VFSAIGFEWLFMGYRRIRRKYKYGKYRIEIGERGAELVEGKIE